MKIKISKLIYWLFIVVLLINCRFFFMYYVNPLYGLLITLATVAIIWFVESKQNHQQMYDERYFKLPFIRKICIVTIIIFAGFFVLSKLKYPGQSFMQTFSGETGQYTILFVLLIYPLIKISNQKGGIKWIFSVMNVLSAVLYVLVLAQFFIYNLNGSVFLPYYSNSAELLILRGTLRISLSWFGNFMIVYNFYMFYRDRQKTSTAGVLHVLLFILGLIDCLLVERVRGVTWVITACIIFIALSDRNTTRGFWKKIVALVVVAIGVFGTDVVSNFVSSMSTYAERGYSTTARLYGIEYYWNVFKGNPLFGFGFADGSTYYSLVHGNGMASISDVGIFGQMAKYGVFVIPIYVYPLIRAIVKIYQIRKSKVIKDFPLYFSLALYILLTSVTYIVICSQSLIILWPVFLVVTEYAITADMHRTEMVEP